MLREVIFIPNRNRYERIIKSHILYMEAQGAYVDIYLINKDKHRISTNLQQFIEQISDDYFFKVSRKHIININQITAFQNNKVWFDEKEIIVTKTYKLALESKLPIIRTKFQNEKIDSQEEIDISEEIG